MRNVLITGASHGIGRACAYAFAESGYNVAVNYNTSEIEANKIVSDLSKKGVMAIACKADVSDAKQTNAMVQKVLSVFGKIDVLVCSSGISKICATIDYTTQDYRKIMDTNFGGTYNATMSVLENMIKNQSGKIIYISSIWGLKGSSCEALYSASKFAQIGFAKSIAKELAPSNIFVNVLAPGFVDTKMNDDLTQEEKNEVLKEIPIGRMAKAEEVANVALMLADERNTYTTGQVIAVDGGWN